MFPHFFADGSWLAMYIMSFHLTYATEMRHEKARWPRYVFAGLQRR